MRARSPRIILLVAAALGVVIASPRRGAAVTQVNGSTFVEDVASSRPGDASNLFQTGVALDVVPSVKKNVKANLNLKLNYVRTDEDELAHFSPFGNLGLDLIGEAYSLNAQQTRYATLGTETELTETTVSRASLSIAPKDLPSLSASVSRTASQVGSRPATTGDNALLSATYRYESVQLRAGYSADRRESGTQGGNTSSVLSAGASASSEVLPATVVAADVDVSRFEARSAGTSRTSTDTRGLRLNADSRPLGWLTFLGNFSRTDTEFRSRAAFVPATTHRVVEGTANVLPHPALRLSATRGNRRFNDVQAVRSVDYTTLAASFSRELRERVLFGATASRTFESDPAQGENVSDGVGLTAAADLTSRVALRLNTSVSRSENRTFVSAQTFNASGTLADRDRIDGDAGGLPAGFIFLDTEHGDLYTKRSSAIGDWTLTLHLDPVVSRYSASRSVQVLATPTDRTNLVLSYTATASAASVPLARIGNQALNGSLTYLATRRSSLGLSGTASFPERGPSAYSATGSWSYRFVRGHQMSLSYGRQVTVVRENDTLSALLSLSLRKRTSMVITYSATQLFRELQTHFVGVRASHSF